MLVSFLDFQVKQIMEEAVTRKFVHEDSSHIFSFCGVVEACVLHGLKRRAAGFLRSNKLAALFMKMGKMFPPAEELCRKVQELEQIIENKQNQGQMSQESVRKQPRPPNLSPLAVKHLWIRAALTEKLLDKIVLYLVENSSKFYEREALLRDPVDGPILASLLVGPCALEYTKAKTANHFWTDPSADELVQRHRIHSGHCRQDSPTKRPALIQKRQSSGSMDDRPSLWARDYVQSLHQNSRATLLFGKNNVLVQPTDDMEAILGYLSLHQTADLMTLKWTPNQLMNGNMGEFDYEKSVYWDYAMTIRLEEIVYLHCHQQDLCIQKRQSSGSMDDRPSLWARDYVQSLHQNSRATLLFGKNNVLVQPTDDMEAILGYLSLHQTADLMTLKWTPNQLMNGNMGEFDYEKSVYWDYAMTIRLEEIVYLHCHQQETRSFCVLPQGKVFPKLRKSRPHESSESFSDKEEDEATDYVFRIIFPGSQEFVAPELMDQTVNMWQPTPRKSSCSSCLQSGSSDGGLPNGCNHDRAPLKLLCETMKHQIISRAFYGWLAYCRHLSTVRTHLSALVNPTIIEPDIPYDARSGLSAEVWKTFLQDSTAYEEKELLRLVYYGGVEPTLRKEVWPFLLGHYHFSMSLTERKEMDEQVRACYEQTMSEWLGCEAIVRQREKEQHAAALAKCASGASVDHGSRQDSTISTDSSQSSSSEKQSHARSHSDSNSSTQVFGSVDEVDPIESEPKPKDEKLQPKIPNGALPNCTSSPDSGHPSSRNFSVTSALSDCSPSTEETSTQESGPKTAGRESPSGDQTEEKTKEARPENSYTTQDMVKEDAEVSQTECVASEAAIKPLESDKLQTLNSEEEKPQTLNAEDDKPQTLNAEDDKPQTLNAEGDKPQTLNAEEKLQTLNAEDKLQTLNSEEKTPQTLNSEEDKLQTLNSEETSKTEMHEAADSGDDANSKNAADLSERETKMQNSAGKSEQNDMNESQQDPGEETTKSSESKEVEIKDPGHASSPSGEENPKSKADPEAYLKMDEGQDAKSDPQLSLDVTKISQTDENKPECSSEAQNVIRTPNEAISSPQTIGWDAGRSIIKQITESESESCGPITSLSKQSPDMSDDSPSALEMEEIASSVVYMSLESSVSRTPLTLARPVAPALELCMEPSINTSPEGTDSALSEEEPEMDNSFPKPDSLAVTGDKNDIASPVSSIGTTYSQELVDLYTLNLHRIDKDVHRCDRNYWYFTPDNLEKLRNIMCSYVWQHLDIGYVQGMCDLLAPLLVILDDEAMAFSCFTELMKRMNQNFPHGGAMDTHFANMRSLIQILDSELFELMQQNGDYTHFYFCYRWFLLDFKREMVYDDVFSVWETIWAARFASSEHFVLFIALALVELYRDIILENNMDFTDIIKFFNEMAEHHDVPKLLLMARELVHKVQILIENK
ncbi:small G protein signaling modulator 1 [Sinocyclocheilus rhinocerous]|uniref:small G protein signaling modulator 1 n=1 Tax=Sinocyclocheilus rhinocerous TaxID=307959 RepID=UPI0007BA52C7|nr:PREDICTED: small G protein signaling modulator 1-like [Sinocyclocheilus rhinocerous]